MVLILSLFSVSTDTEQHIGLGLVVASLLALFTWTVKRFISSEQKTLREEQERRKQITDAYIARLEKELEEKREDEKEPHVP